jgi:hypothetical protein
MIPTLKWEPDRLELGAYSFILDFSASIGESNSRYPEFVLMKDKNNIMSYIEVLGNFQVKNLLELGIMKGGSCALFEALWSPMNHMAIDISRHAGDSCDELTNEIERTGRRFRAVFGVEQTNLRRILLEWQALTDQANPEFDVVMDDASHGYDESLLSFNGLFPFVRPGGVYVIEDWGWAHWTGPTQDPSHSQFNSPALSNLACECVLATTGLGGVIEKTIVTPNQLFIFKGQVNCPDPFDIRNVPRRGRRSGPFF